MKDYRVDALEGILLAMEREGVDLYLNGRRSRARDIAKRCRVCEKRVYMPDYVMDEKGRLREVRYDEVKEW